MKKILITGFYKSHTDEFYFKSTVLQVVSSLYSLIQCLRSLNYDVEVRPVKPGENLKHFDDVIVYIGNPSSFSTPYTYGALYAISNRPDCIIAFDDWQISEILKNYNNYNEENIQRKFLIEMNKTTTDEVKPFIKDIMKGVEIVKNLQNKTLVTTFEGGNPELLFARNKIPPAIFTFNPNPYHINKKPNKILSSPKERVFNFAGLCQKETKKWLKAQKIEETGWELKLYGSRKDGQDRVVEQQMVQIYSEQWGILMAGYYHAGSGWWRARPLQVADAGSILIGEPSEMIILYNDFELSNIRPIDLIDKTDNQLKEIAAAQKEALYKTHPLDKEVTKQELLKCLMS